MAGFFIGKLSKKIAKSIGLAWVDRSLGALFGLARGALVALVALFVIGGTSMRQAPWFQSSRVAPEFSALLYWMDAAFPNNFNPVWVSKNQARHLLTQAKTELNDGASHTPTIES